MADQRSFKYFRTRRLILCAVSEIILVIAWMKSGEFFGSEGSVWLCLLFGLPVLIQVFGLWHLYSKFESNHHLLSPAAEPNDSPRQNVTNISDEMPNAEPDLERVKALVSYSTFYVITMAICLLTYSVMWVLYVYAQHSYGWESAAWDKGVTTMTWGWSQFYFGVSVFALVIIGVLLCLVMWMTRAIIGENKPQEFRLEFLNPSYLKRGAAEAPFLTLIFFITVFLGVSYLFGFSFAFHDKARLFVGGESSSQEPALVMGNVMGAGPAEVPYPSPDPSPTKIATLTFGVGTSVLNSENDDQIIKAVNAIEEKSTNDKAVRILLIGGADLRQIKSLAYQSNYELAEARAQNAKSQILGKLSTSKSANVMRNLEWTCLAQPNEGRTSNSSHHNRRREPLDDEGKDDRTVQVLLMEVFEAPAQLLVRNLRANHPRPLRLMDYIYFANYTITTTGYGDIVPNTTYAKFICSFANICEVVFLVVFFNALLSLAGAMTISSIARQVGVLHDKWRNGPPVSR